VWLASVGLMGYFRRRINMTTRLITGIGGLMLLVPASAFAGAIWTDLFGALIMALFITRELKATAQALSQ
jgi:hypothetical protein